MKLIGRLLCWWRGKHSFKRSRAAMDGDQYWTVGTRIKVCRVCYHIAQVRARKRKAA